MAGEQLTREARLHLVGLTLDDYVGFGPAELFIPFRSTYEPGAVAWGIAAMYLLLAVQLSSWAMRRLPRKLWHRIHLCSLPLVVAASIHGFTAGTDRDRPAIQWATFAATITVVFLVVFRLLSPRHAERPAPRSAAAATPQAEPGPAPIA